MQEVPPSDKLASPFDYRRLLASLASSQWLTNFNSETFYNSFDMTKRKDNTAQGRTKHIDIRLTEDEYTLVVNKANECGLTLSDYGRRLLQSHRPNKRLSIDEVHALNSLSDARADLIRIQNVLKSKPDEVKRQYFRDATFMRTWIASVDRLIIRWGQIRDSINQN